MSEREYRYKKDGKNRDSKDRNNGRDVSTSKNIKIAAALLIPTVKNINKSTNKSISKSISTDKNIQKV